jgi:hypothetical protein
MREKIKAFLASQGMIKGHSSSAPRSVEREPITLRLVDDSGYSSSSSSESSEDSGRPVSIGGDDTHFLITSSTRDEKYYLGGNHHYDQPQLGVYLTSFSFTSSWSGSSELSVFPAMPVQDQELSPDTIYSSTRLNHDVMFPALPITSSSDSLVPTPCKMQYI